MSLVAPVKDGKVVETSSQSSMEKAKKSSSSGMDKDAFLQLLVAQMKYQDPLEPTSNTEFISQYAQFSQVEQLQNMAVGMDLQGQQPGGPAGKSEDCGQQQDVNYEEGKVDYVAYENGKAFLSVNGELYSIDDLETVADEEYLEAVELAMKWVTALNKLPSVATISMDEAEDIDKLKEEYDNMTDYQKSFIASEKVKALEAYVERLAEVRKTAEEADKTEGSDKTDESDKTEEADKTEGTDPAES